MVAPVQVGAAVERLAVQAQQLGELDQRRGIDLDQIGALIEAVQVGVFGQQGQAVQIVVGDDDLLARIDPGLDVVQHLFRADQIDGLAQQADAFARTTGLPERHPRGPAAINGRLIEC